jgi:DNA ligase (NAD+)
MHRCPNPKCESRGLETLINWVWDIDGVGEQAIRRLWREGIVTSLPDLYRLTKEQLLELDGYGEISATNVVESIEQSKQRFKLHRILAGLNIPDTGWVTARNLAAHFGSIDKLMAASQEEIQEAEGIGPGRAEGIAEWFSDEENLKLIDELRGLGLNFESGDELKPVEGPLTGQTYVITGTLEGFTRDEAAKALEAQGAKVGNSVSKKTAGLIVGEEPGSKLKKAQEAGVPILDEKALAKLLTG